MQEEEWDEEELEMELSGMDWDSEDEEEIELEEEMGEGEEDDGLEWESEREAEGGAETEEVVRLGRRPSVEDGYTLHSNRRGWTAPTCTSQNSEFSLSCLCFEL